jgi:hypothetical protein
LSSLNANDEDWVVMQDGDILYLTGDWGKRIYDALALGWTINFGLVGCYTNRLRAKHQLHNHEFNYDLDVRRHYEIALELTKVKASRRSNNILLVFLWPFNTRPGSGKLGLRRIVLLFDSLFSMRVKEMGLNIGLIKSLYVFHGVPHFGQRR